MSEKDSAEPVQQDHEQTHEETEKAPPKAPAKFDLSDGIQKEDFIALGTGLWHAILWLLKLIFYPLVWLKREFVRLVEFFRSHAERPLTEDEIRFVSSIPLFLSTLGTLFGTLLGIVAFVSLREDFLSKLEDIGSLFSWLGELIKGLWDVFTFVLGIFAGLLVGLKDFIVNEIFGSDTPTEIPFIVLSIVGFVGVVLLLVVIESKFVHKSIQRLKVAFAFVLEIPYMIYDGLDSVWNGVLLTKVGQPIMGGEMLGTNTNTFYQKVVRFTLAFAVISFLAGIALFWGDSELSDFNDVTDIFFLILVMLVSGVVAGFVFSAALVRFLARLGAQKYSIEVLEKKGQLPVAPAHTSADQPVRTAADTSSPQPASSTTPASDAQEQASQMTAKERAEERRRRREARKQARDSR